ncbi:MAG TPA: DUF6266 family protein [Pelobium sp.]|nr:DUF6266 family protein [Pelobium sp.]
MAIIKNGINGAFSGKVGTIVGTSWRGLNIIRSKPKPPTHFSEKQLANQMKMKLIQFFLKKMVAVVRIGFKDDDIIPTAFNSAMSYNKKNAIVGEFPELSIDFSLVRLAQGTLYFPEDFQMENDDAGLHFTWNKNSGDNGSVDDQLLIVTWNEEEAVCDYSLQAYRSNGEFNFMPNNIGQGTQVWVAFVRQDRTMQSNSVYMGMVG